MAMMKYGRTTMTSTPPDEKKPKVKVSEEEFLKREKEIEEYDNRLSFYNEDLKQYKKDLDLYEKGPKNSKFSAKKFNEDLEKKLKSGEVVRWNDPSISKTTKNLIVGSQRSRKHGVTDEYGKVDEFYLPKGTDIKSYKDLYGVDFNPDEFEARSKKGDLDDYLKEHGLTGQNVFRPKISPYYHYKGVTPPEHPGDRPKSYDKYDVDWKMPVTEKPKKIKHSQKTLSDLPEARNVSEWQAPTPKGTKSALKLDVSREGGQGGKFGLRKKITPSSGKSSPAVIFNEETQTYTRPKGLRYKREEKLAKSFYSPVNERGKGGYYAQGERGFGNSEFSGDMKQAIKKDIKGIRSEKKEFRKESNLSFSDKRSAMKDFREDLSGARKAKRYVRMGDLNSEGEQTWREGDKSKLRYFTPDTDKYYKKGAMAGYVESAESYTNRISDLEKIKNRNITNSMLSKGKKSEAYAEKAREASEEIPTLKSKLAQYKGWQK